MIQKNLFKLGVLVAALMISACGSETKSNGSGTTQLSGNRSSASGSVYGTWGGFPTITTDGGKLTMTLRLRLEEGRCTVMNRCKADDGSVVDVEATVPARYTATTIEFLSTKEAVRKVNGLTCRASVDKATTANYRVDGDSLHLEKDGEAVVLKRQ